MLVRRFEATTMKDALTAVKRELGPNAVILSTKEIPDKSSGVKLFEITAASSVQTIKAGAEQAGSATTDYDFGPELLAKLNELNEILPNKSQLRIIEGAVRDVKNILLESLRGQADADSVPNHLFSIIQSLKASKVDPAIIAEIKRHLMSQPEPADLLKASADRIEEFYKDQTARWILKRIKIAPKWNTTPGVTNIHAFVGTPGAGKTTLLSKVATAIKKKERHKAALITFDPSKVGASEQTRIYAKILDIPHHSIQTPTELKKVVMGLKSYDLVLLDTPGQNPFDVNAAQDLEVIKNLGLNLEFHLVISATEKIEVSERAIAAFSNLAISSISMTKLDEISSYGELFTLNHRWGLPVSYLGNSNDLATGIEKANREAILQRLINL